MFEPPIPGKNTLEQSAYLLRKGGTITKGSETPVAGNVLPYCYVEITALGPIVAAVKSR